MKKIFLPAAAVILSFFASCDKEIPQTPNDEQKDPTPPEVVDGTSFTFRAEYPALTEDTKTTVDNATGSVAWKEGDKITLYYLESSGTPASTTATATAGGRSVEFTASIPSDINAVWAAYPAGSGELDIDGAFKIKTGVTHNGHFDQANFAAAWSEVSADDMVLKFKNVVGLFRIGIPAGGVITRDGASCTIQSVTIVEEDDACLFGGDVTVTVGDGGEISFSEPENAVNSCSVELDDKSRSEGYVWLHSLPVNAENGLTFRFKDTESNWLPALVTVEDKAVGIERGHIKPVDNASEAIVFDWYFSENGTGNGKSAASPAGVETLQKLLNDTQHRYGQWRLHNAVLHLADGTYTLTEQLAFKGSEEGDIRVEGQSREGTVINGKTLGGATTQMITYGSKMNLHLSHLTFRDGTSALNGGVMNTTGSGKIVCTDVGFVDNKTTTAANSGAIYYGGTGGAEFIGCLFHGNEAPTKVAGAIATGGSATGTIVIKGCTFEENKTGAGGVTSGCDGGAIYVSHSGKVLVDSCVFENNQAYATSGAIRVQGANSVVYVTRSAFRSNTITKSGYADNGACIYANTGSAIGIYNCTFNYNHSSASSSSSSVFSAINYVVANCTFVESMKVSYGVISNRATEDHLSTIVNNIAITTSETATHCALACAGKAENNHADCGYNLVTRIQTNFTAASNDKTTYTPVSKADFGFEDQMNMELMSYPWNGDLSGIPSYGKCSLQEVKELILANTVIGEDFWNYLETTRTGAGDKLSEVDVRGVRRNTSVLWPGSYQQD